MDTAVHPWTLENPAYGWFGLSSAARIRVGGNEIHAISVAEVVTPAEAESAPLARDLMVALVRAGVTATCSGADKPRYGHLEVDSNLPDTRIALGGPERNAFTAAVLSAADPAYTAELQRQLETRRKRKDVRPGVSATGDGVGARRRPARRARALPVLLVAGNSDDDAAGCHSRGDRGPRGRGDRGLAAGAESVIGTFEERTVALLNRGVPSFAVEIGRHPAHLADAVVHGLAVGGVDHP